MILNNELEGMWKKMVRTHFKLICQHFPGGTEKTKRNCSWNIHCYMLDKANSNTKCIKTFTSLTCNYKQRDGMSEISPIIDNINMQ